MSGPMRLWIEGIGAWSPGAPDWAAWRELLRAGTEPDANAPVRPPQPKRLAASERRRASAHVLAAIEVADQAVTMSGHEGDLACVFASAHGDAAVMDYICAVLADTPGALSPTRFHNSVHNAAAGYWTIATSDHAASNAVAALDCTFGAGLLEAAAQAVAENQPVLLVASDEPGSGPLAQVLATTRPFACALVLAARPGPNAQACLELTLTSGAVPAERPRQPYAKALAEANLSARGLTLLEALATDNPATKTLAAAPGLGLAMRLKDSVKRAD